MSGNPLVRFDEGRVGRTLCRPLSYSTASASNYSPHRRRSLASSDSLGAVLKLNAAQRSAEDAERASAVFTPENEVRPTNGGPAKAFNES